MALFYIGENMVSPHCCFIKEEYFNDKIDYINMLDSGNTCKQSKRTHMCVSFFINNSIILVPLRNNLGEPNRKFGKIGFSVPSASRQNAGLDYRYSLIINDNKYLEYHTTEKLPQSQYDIITLNYDTIKDELLVYVNKYITMARKNRHMIEPLFRKSSLINFHKELEI